MFNLIFIYRRLGSRTSIQMKTLVTIGRHAVLTNSLIDFLPCEKPVEQYQRSLWMQQVYSRLCGKCIRTDVYSFPYVKITVFVCMVEDKISVSYS